MRFKKIKIEKTDQQLVIRSTVRTTDKEATARREQSGRILLLFLPEGKKGEV